MIRRVAIGVACWLLAALPIDPAAQIPPRAARNEPAAPAGTGAISGAVVTADNSARPLRMAHVVLIGASTGTLRVTSTDGEGRFEITGLPADRYVIGASKPPFLGAVAGARRPARSGTPLVLENGQRIPGVVIRLPPGAAIAGVITDERGQSGMRVAVGLQRIRVEGGERVPVSDPGSTVMTDELGRYRIHGLTPGEYVVSGMRVGPGFPGARALTDAEVDNALKGGTLAPAAAASAPLTYAPVFFPGTTRASDAVPITLAVGEERQGVDFRLELVATARIEGTVVTSDGQPPGSATVALTTSPASPLQTFVSARVGPDGGFALLNVAPGSYTLVAQTFALQSGQFASQAGQFATASVEVAGVDAYGIQLTLRPPLAFSARIAFDSASPSPPLAGRRVSLRSVTPSRAGGAAPQVGATDARGVFAVTRLFPGRYVLGGPLFFGATSDSLTWALQSVTVDGRDMTDLPLDISAETLPKDVVVTYGDRWQELSGRLQHASGMAAIDYTIVVFPADKAYWIAGSRRILTTRPGTDGRFRTGGPGPLTLPPGDYLVAAVTDIDRDEQFDPAFLAALVPGAVPVTLGPGERKVQDLSIK